MNPDGNGPRINTDQHGLRHGEFTCRVIGVFYDVYNEGLGHGFLESVYENALAIALRRGRGWAKQQHALGVWFRGQQVGDFAHLVVNDAVFLELKAARAMEPVHEAQLLN